MNFDNLLNDLAKQNEPRPQDGDYIQEGLLICGECNTPKECEVEVFGTLKKFGCLCKCQSEKYWEEKIKMRQQEEADRISRLRAEGIQDRNFRDWTFDNDDGSNPGQMDKAMRYCPGTFSPN